MDLDAIEAGLFFIVGAPRSGTTLVRAILSAHPQIVVPPETKFFLWFEPPTGTNDWSAYLQRLFASAAWTSQSLDAEAFRERVEATDRSARSVFLTMLAMHAERAGRSRVGEKTPLHVHHVERLHALFPAARFICVYRDPRDVVASQLRMPWERWSHLRRARTCAELMQRVHQLEQRLPAEVFMTVRYESLVEESEAEVRRLCAFLGEAYDDTLLAFHKRDDPGFTGREVAWAAETRRPISAASIGRYATDLSPRKVAGLERVLRPTLEAFEYGPGTAEGRYRPHWYVLDVLDRACDGLVRLRHALGRLTRRHRKRAPLGGRTPPSSYKQDKP
jgi:hypothetical protein